jgi:hypothetical protein
LEAGDTITVPADGRLSFVYGINTIIDSVMEAKHSYFGPGTYKVEDAAVTITPSLETNKYYITLLSGTDDTAKLSTKDGSINISANEFIRNSANAVQLGFGGDDYEDSIWRITATDAAYLTAVDNPVEITLGPSSISVMPNTREKYAVLRNDQITPVVYEITAKATHAAPFLISNVVVVLEYSTNASTLKIANGAEIKLSATLEDAGATYYKGGGGILLTSSGGSTQVPNKLAIGSAILSSNTRLSTPATAKPGKIVGDTNSAAGILASSATFAATPSATTFALTEY